MSEGLAARTVAAANGVAQDAAFGAVIAPIHLSTTFKFPTFEQPGPYDYSRLGNPTRDALADTIAKLEGGARAVLVASGRMWWLPALLIAAREVGMSWYRSWIGRRGVSVPANQTAKVKTWVQCIAVGLVLLPATASHPLVYGSVVWLAVGLTLFTGAMYAVEGRRLAAILPAPPRR